MELILKWSQICNILQAELHSTKAMINDEIKFPKVVCQSHSFSKICHISKFCYANPLQYQQPSKEQQAFMEVPCSLRGNMLHIELSLANYGMQRQKNKWSSINQLCDRLTQLLFVLLLVMYKWGTSSKDWEMKAQNTKDSILYVCYCLSLWMTKDLITCCSQCTLAFGSSHRPGPSPQT